MALRMIKGSTVDINFDPKNLEIYKRGEVAEKYISLKITELFRFVIFWTCLGITILLIAFTFLVSKIFILPLMVMAYLTIRRHFRYLQAWSAWNKWARRSVARVDLKKDKAIYGQPMMPWINIKEPE